MDTKSKTNDLNFLRFLLSIMDLNCKSIIVHLPIDLTHEQHYDAFNPESFNLHAKSELAAEFEQDRFEEDKCVTEITAQQFFDSDIQSRVVHCWHCVREITSKPCGIPVRFENDVFFVKGLFCCFNCALTYNFNSNELDCVIQERESLLRMMCKNQELHYAPPRESLLMFGGNLTLEEFHSIQNHVRVIEFPMVPLVTHIEEVNPIALK